MTKYPLLPLGALCAVLALVSAHEPDVCAMEMDLGFCTYNYRMFYYDQGDRKCKQFIFGGCGGNPNKFSSWNACHQKCIVPNDICRMEREVGYGGAAFRRYFFNSTSGDCEMFNFEGAGGNENNFQMPRDCEDACIPKDTCSLSVEPGECPGGMVVSPDVSYYYNEDDNTCREFQWSGCGGNENNFNTMESCLSYCQPRSPSVEICDKALDAGECDGDFPRYYYDKNDGTCKSFSYGGCGGNANRFATLEACRQTCSSDDICNLPSSAGPCTGAQTYYYFNHVADTCEDFYYSGCGGNMNRFATSRECTQRCKNEDICTMTTDPGPCEAAITRYHFDNDLGSCETFIYGGCLGNENNFLTADACQRTCVPIINPPAGAATALTPIAILHAVILASLLLTAW